MDHILWIWKIWNASSSLTYFVHHVLERDGAVNGKADEEKVCFGVGERSKSVVFFLAGSIPESEFHSLA